MTAMKCAKRRYRRNRNVLSPVQGSDTGRDPRLPKRDGISLTGDAMVQAMDKVAESLRDLKAPAIAAR